MGVGLVGLIRRLWIATAFAVTAASGSADAASKTAPPHMSCTGAPNEVLVIVKDVKTSVGLITAELYRNDPEHFLSNEGRELRMRVAARAPITQFCIHAPEATGYALALYHDKNANMHLDKGVLGIPVEPYGVSNNPRMRVAAPTIDEALFEVASNGATIEIDLRN